MTENIGPDGIYLTGWYAGQVVFADGVSLMQILADPLGVGDGLGRMAKDAVTVFLARALSVPVPVTPAQEEGETGEDEEE